MTTEELTQIAAQEQAAARQVKYHINVCVAAGCLSLQSDLVQQSLSAELRGQGLEHQCQIKGVGCLGLCKAGPLVAVEPAGILYQGVASADASDIVKALDTELVK